MSALGQGRLEAYLAEGRGRGGSRAGKGLRADQGQKESLVRLVSQQGYGKHRVVLLCSPWPLARRTPFHRLGGGLGYILA